MGDSEIEFMILFAHYTELRKRLEITMNALYEIAYPAYFGNFLSAMNIARETIEKIEEEEK